MAAVLPLDMEEELLEMDDELRAWSLPSIKRSATPVEEDITAPPRAQPPITQSNVSSCSTVVKGGSEEEVASDGDQGGGLTIILARYGIARNLLEAEDLGNVCLSGFKDVTDVVRGAVENDELHLNPSCSRGFFNKYFDFDLECAIMRRVGIRYRYGSGAVQDFTTMAVPFEAYCVHITRKGHSDRKPLVSEKTEASKHDPTQAATRSALEKLQV